MGLFDPQIATTQSSLSYDPALQDAFKNLISQSQGIAGIGYQGYSGPRVAGLSPEQQQFIQQAPSSLNPALAYANMNGSDALAQFGNPFQQSVIDASTNDINRQYDISGQGVAANSALNGQVDSFGDRSQVLQAENERNRNDTLARTTAGLNTQNYGQAMGMAANRSTQLAGLSQQQMSNLLSAGQMNQNQTQQQDNVDYGNFLEQRGWPQQQASWLMSQLQGAPKDYSQTQQQLGPSTGAGIAGLGAAGVGLSSMLGGAASGISKLFSGSSDSPYSGPIDYGTGEQYGPTSADFFSGGDSGMATNNYAHGGIARGYADGGQPSPDSPNWADRKAYWDAQARGTYNGVFSPSWPTNVPPKAGIAAAPTVAQNPDLRSLIGMQQPQAAAPASPGMSPPLDLDAMMKAYKAPTVAPVAPAAAAQSAVGMSTDPTLGGAYVPPTPTPQPQAGITPTAAVDAGGAEPMRIADQTMPNGGAMAAAQAGVGGSQPGAIKPPPATPMPQQPQQAGVAPQMPQPTDAGPAPSPVEPAAAAQKKLETSAQQTLKAAAPPDSDTKSDIPEWAMPLASAGFAMMASKSPFILNAVGEGGLAGLAQYNQHREQEIKNKLAERQVSTSERAQTETGRHNVASEDIQSTTAQRQLTNAEKQLDIAKRSLDNQIQRGEKEDKLGPAKMSLLSAQADYYRAKAAHGAGSGGTISQIADQIQADAEDQGLDLSRADAIKLARGKDIGPGAGQARVDTTQQNNRATYIAHEINSRRTNGEKITPAVRAEVAADADQQFPLQPGGPKVAPTQGPAEIPGYTATGKNDPKTGKAIYSDGKGGLFLAQ